MAKGRILYINQEIIPYSLETEVSYYGRYLPSYIQEQGREIRTFMPRFSYVNERRNQLHEVIRLSGMNLIINNCDHQLLIKVASIASARMQVYFIDNDEYFTKHDGIRAEDGTFYPDNDERILFYGRGALEAVRKLSWQPHLIHYGGWFAAMVPFYLRRLNKENSFFSGTKMVLSLFGDDFPEKFNPLMEKKLKSDGATAKDLRMYDGYDYMSIMKTAITYSHGIVIASPNVNPELVAYAKENKRHVIDYAPKEEQFPVINKLYDTLIGSNINN